MARDKIHMAVRRALEKDGWTITHDPLVLLPNEADLEVDLGAEKLIAAEKGLVKIAVEIKGFEQPSVMYEFHRAIGQYFDYETALMVAEDERILFAAVPATVYPKLLASRVIKTSMERMNMKLIIVDIKKEEVDQWIK